MTKTITRLDRYERAAADARRLARSVKRLKLPLGTKVTIEVPVIDGQGATGFTHVETVWHIKKSPPR